MEAELYADTCRLIAQLCPHGRKSREQFSDALILKVHFFSTQSDRPVRWVCRSKHWPEKLLIKIAGGELPSRPCMSRRLRTAGVLQLIERVQKCLSDKLLAHQPGSAVVKVIDSKPLRVSRYSKDHDARNGYAAGDKSRGYKVHAITAGKAFVHCNGCDSNPVHSLARSVNHQLLAPPRRSNAQVRDVRRNTTERIRSLDLFADPLQHSGIPSAFAADVTDQRDQIERNFGNAAMHGLTSPPPWVRTPHRIAAWTAAKLIQTMARQLQIIGVMI